jgi:hypothetical protein
MSVLDTLRKPKIWDIAVFDLFGTILGAAAIGYVARINILMAIVIALLLGIVVHYALNIPTRLNQYLGLTTEQQLRDARNKK